MGENGGAWRLLGALLIGLAPPTAVAATHWTLATHPSATTVLILLGYELVVFAGGLALRVWRILEADWAKRLAAWVNSTVTRWLAGYGSSYRRGVRLLHRYFDELGLSYRGENPAAVEDVFVDVTLVRRQPGKILNAVVAKEIADKDAEPMRHSIWDFLDDQEYGPVRLTIIGPPGSGKTTLLQHITLTITRKSRRDGKQRRSVPVLLFLRDCCGQIMANPRISLSAVIETQVEPLAGKPPVDWFKKRLAEGQCVVMFDGADEIADRSDRQAVHEWIHLQVSRYPGNDYLVTSRSLGHREYSYQDGTVLQVREFTPAQIRNFVDGWYRSAEWNPLAKASAKISGKMSAEAEKLLERIDRTALAQLAANPLLLTMICRVNRHRGELPTTRPELYQEFCDVLLENRQRGRRLTDHLKPGETVGVLRRLAFTMMERRLEKPSAREMTTMIKMPLKRISTGIDPEDFLASVHYAGLLTESEHGGYSFVHQTFCEYLAATAIIESGRIHVLLENVADPWWRETSLFYAAIEGADRIVDACLKSDRLPALALAFQCADVDRSLDSGLRRRLSALLGEATDPNVPAERRRLAAAVIATRELRPVILLASDVRVCDAPVSRRLFEIFISQSTGEFPSRGPASDTDAVAGLAAVGVREPYVLAFLNWLNGLSDGQRLYRLPTRAEADDPRFASKNHCVWLASPDEPQELDLWGTGAEHPHVVSDRHLRERAEADGKGQFGQVLATALAFALVHTLGVANTLLLRRTRNQALVTEMGRNLRLAADLAVQSIDRLAPDVDSHLNRVLKNALHTVKGRAQSPGFAEDLASAVASSVNFTPTRALDLAIDLARFRAGDLDVSLRVLNGHLIGTTQQESMIAFSRPTSRPRELMTSSGRVLASALDRALDQALRWAQQSEVDLDVPMCLQFARQLPVPGQQRAVLDPIWGPAFATIVKQWQGRKVRPGSLTRISAEARNELSDLTTDSSDYPPADRLMAVATKVHEQVGEITDPGFDLAAENISYARLGAIALAANLARHAGNPSLAGKYLDIAVGVTSIERQFLGQELPQETMILVQA